MSAAVLALPGSAVARGEAAFQEARRLRRRASLFYGAVLLFCVLVAAWISEASPERLAEGLPRIGEYFWRVLPTFSAATEAEAIVRRALREPQWRADVAAACRERVADQTWTARAAMVLDALARYRAAQAA